MLDLNLIREQPEVVRQSMSARQMDSSPVDAVLALDEQRRSLIQDVEALKAERNAVSKEIGRMKDPAERQAKIDAMRLVGERISGLDERLRQVEEELNANLAIIPNLPDPRTPYGKDDSENVVLRTVGEAAEIRFHAQGALGPGPRAGHHRFRARRQDHRLALLRAERGGRPLAARSDRLYAGPAHPPGLYREIHALHGQGRRRCSAPGSCPSSRTTCTRTMKKTCGWCRLPRCR